MLLGHFAIAQNCGQVTNFIADIVNNGNGTSTYTFQVTASSTSGGNKSVLISVECVGGAMILPNTCLSTTNTPATTTYGPFTVATCTSSLKLTWTGYTTSACASGTTCTATQTISFAVLPVELTSFKAVRTNDGTMLAWATASEQDNEKFMVERSLNGTDFEPIGEVAGRGTTTSAQSYSFVDERPLSGTNLYRLKQVDFSGDFSYSEIVAVKMAKQGDIAAYPTPFSEGLTLDLPENLDSDENLLTIYNLHGQLVHQQLLQGSGSQQLELGGLNPGQYVLCITTGSHTQRISIIKQ